MKSITELIEELEKIREDEGDIDVFNTNEEEIELQLSSIVGNKILVIM